MSANWTQLLMICCFLLLIHCNDNGNHATDPPDPPPSFDGTVTDADGNVYHTVKIGNQIWTTENLRTTHYNDRSPIPQEKDPSAFSKLSTPAYCYYNNTNNTDDIKKSGALYNWYTVNTKKLAPAGWHVPSNSEWETLQTYLIANGYNWDNTTTGNKIAKSLAGKTGWRDTSILGAIGNIPSMNNKSGFSGMPSGSLYGTGFGRKDETHWWSSTEGYSWFFESISTDLARHSHGATYGFSVRLIKD